jgi:hypothetical protein
VNWQDPWFIPPLKPGDMVIWKAHIGYGRGIFQDHDPSPPGKPRMRVSPFPMNDRVIYVMTSRLFGVRCPKCGQEAKLPDRENPHGWLVLVGRNLEPGTNTYGCGGCGHREERSWIN